MYIESVNNVSDILQLDGNISINETCQAQPQPKPKVKGKCDKFTTALDLPIVASYNCRSLFPKVQCFKTDLIERKIDCAFTSEVWEQSESKEHSMKIE